MEMIELSKIVSDEKKVIQYLQQKAILKKFDSCPLLWKHTHRKCKKKQAKMLFL